MIAADLRKRRLKPHTTWQLDEVYLKIDGRTVVQFPNLEEGIARLDRTIVKIAQKDETARRLMTIPGFGPIVASTMAATVQETCGSTAP